MNKNLSKQELTKKVEELEKKIAQNQWLHEKENLQHVEEYSPFYGDVTELNTERTILDNVGKETLKTLTSELMDLLDTSVAIYEKNGDYAYGVFNSGWCQLLDASSRKLCNTKDNKKALNCGKWLCHDDCWNNSAKAAIESKKSTDIDCIGSIKLYGEPIFTGNEVIGVINIGYGNPPTDDKTLKELSEKYKIDFDTIKQKSLDYKSRPDFILEIAKKRLKSIAKLIGEIVSRKQFEIALSAKKEEYESVNKDLKQANKNLLISKERAEESEEKFSTVFNMSQSLICIADINTATFQFINPAFNKILGYEEQELLNQSFLNFIHPDDIDSTKEIIKKELKKGTHVMSFENRYLKKNGEYCWLKWNSFPMPEKGITYAIAHDITDRKKSEEELIKEKEKANETRILLKKIINIIPDLVWLKDKDGKYLNCNKRFEDFFGKSENEIVGKTDYDFVDKELQIFSGIMINLQ